MTFTRFQWGVSRPFRNNWPVLGFSTLSQDYPKIVQVNNFLISLIEPIFRRHFRKEIVFSHFLIKVNKTFNVEIFCLTYYIQDLFKREDKNYSTDTNGNYRLYLLRSLRFYRFTEHTRRFKNQPRQKIRRFARFFKVKRQLGLNYLNTRIKKKVFNYFFLSNKKQKFLLSGIKSFSTVNRVNRLTQISRFKTLLSLFENKLDKVILLFRFLSLKQASASLYLSFVMSRISIRKQPSPKALLKSVEKEFKRINRRRFRLKGIDLKAKGRFTRQQRAGKFNYYYGRTAKSLTNRLDFA